MQIREARESLKATLQASAHPALCALLSDPALALLAADLDALENGVPVELAAGQDVKAEGGDAAAAAAVAAYRGRIECMVNAVDKLHKQVVAPKAAGRLLPYLCPKLLRADPKVRA